MDDQLPPGRWLHQRRKARDVPQPELAARITCILSTTRIGGRLQHSAKRLADLFFLMRLAIQQHEPLSSSFAARHFVFADRDRSLIPIHAPISELNKAWQVRPMIKYVYQQAFNPVQEG